MTVWRQEGNGRRQQRRFPRGLAVLSLILGLWPAIGLSQATTERVVVNRVTGYAISGYDPVAYFANGGPLAGQTPYEFAHGGALWRFHNEGNLIAFRDHPEVYEPLFGGYDPVEMARGSAVAGRPGLWLIAGGRLMLFTDPANRKLLQSAPAAWLARAESRWPAMREQLAP